MLQTNDIVVFEEGTDRQGIKARVERVHYSGLGVQSVDVRILAGFRGGGQIIPGVPVENLHLSEIETEETSVLHEEHVIDSPVEVMKNTIKDRYKNMMPVDWICVIGAFFLVGAIAVSAIQKHAEPPKEKTAIEIYADELHTLNIEDAKDVKIKQDALDRISSRKTRKTELLSKLGLN